MVHNDIIRSIQAISNGITGYYNFVVDGDVNRLSNFILMLCSIAVHPNKLLVATGQTSRHAGDRKVVDYKYIKPFAHLSASIFSFA
jgi:hypothetical protein